MAAPPFDDGAPAAGPITRQRADDRRPQSGLRSLPQTTAKASG